VQESRLVHYSLIPATEDDKPWLEDLRRAVYQELFVATWGDWDEDRHQRHWAGCWERGEIRIIDIDGKRVGMIQLFEDEDAVQVGEIQIHPFHQSQGIGTNLLRDTIGRVHKQGKKVSLSTGIQNRRALQLYQRLGFRRIAQSETHDHLECVPDCQG
jgi:ribosomal protein S18 acetylase RimI-like enzyme